MRIIGIVDRLKILIVLFFIIITVSCGISFYYIYNFKNGSTKFDIQVKETSNDFDNKIAALDDISNQLVDFKSLRNNESLLSNSLYLTNNSLISYSNRYLKTNVFNNVTNQLIDEDKINLYDYANNIKDLETDELITDNNTTLIEFIDETKEDKVNKADSYVVNNEGYLSSLGFSDVLISFLDKVYPVGTIYISKDNTTPPIGVWEKLNTNTTLWTTGDTEDLGNYLGATLPNIKGGMGSTARNIGNSNNGPFTVSNRGSSVGSSGASKLYQTRYMDFSRYNGIYKDNATVRPPALAVTIFRRIG